MQVSYFTRYFLFIFLLVSYSSFAQADKEFGELYQKMAQEAQAKNYAQACVHGEQADLLAEKVLSKEPQKLGSFYYNLAGFEAAAADAVKAEKYYKKCLVVRKTLGVSSAEYIKTVDKLATLYSNTGKQAEADKLLAQLKKEQNLSTDTTKISGLDSPEYARTLTNQAIGQIKNKKNIEAEKNLSKALGIYEKNKLENLDFALCADAYAVLLAQRGKYAEAVPLLERALRIRNTQAGEQKDMTQETMLNLAVCYEETKQAQKARELLEKWLSIYEKNNIPNKDKYTEVLATLGRMYLNNKDLEQADKMLQKALNIEKQRTNASGQYVQLLNDLARLEFMRKNIHVAENYIRLAVETSAKQEGKNSANYANTLLNLANILKVQEKNKEAEKLYQQSLQLQKQLKQEKTPEYLNTLSNLADMYRNSYQTEKAVKLYLEILPQQKELLGTGNPEYGQNLANIADCYTTLQKYKEAKSYYEQLISLPNTEKSVYYPKWLMNLGGFAYETGAYKQAELYFKRALSIYEKNLDVKDFGYIEALENLANLYKNQGRYSDSEKIYQEALILCQKRFGETHFTYISLQNNLASLYKSLGRFEEAEQIYKQTLSDASKQGEETTQYAQILNDMGAIYREAGKYAEAEPLLNKALKIRQNILGEKSAEVAETLQNLANLYKQMGRLQEAANAYQKTLLIRKEVLGEMHPDYATTLNTLASLYRKNNELDKAEPLLKEALSIRKEILGENSPAYAFSLDNLANFYQTTQQPAKAEPLYKQAIAIRKIVYGVANPIYAASLNNLAVLYEKNKQATKAEPLYKESMAILAATLGEGHPKYIASLNNLSLFYDKQGKYEQSSPLFQKMVKNTLEQIQKNFSTLSENEKRQFFALNKPFLDNFVLFAANSASRKSPESPQLTKEAYQLLMTTKGIVLNATGKTRKEILESKDESLIKQYEEWQSLREMLSKTYNLGSSEQKNRGIELSTLENRSKVLEKKLSERSKSFAEVFSIQIFKFEDIEQKLKEGEAILDIIRVQGEGKILYIGFVIKKGAKSPEVQILDNGKEIEDQLAFYKNSIRFRKDDKESYGKYWGKFEPMLLGVKKLYFCADGVYSQINPNTLFNPKNNQYLIETFDIHFITNAKDILEPPSAGNLSSGRALLFGNPTYELESKKINKSIDLDNQSSFWLQNSTFQQLPGTQKEVEKIEQILKKNNLLSVQKITQKQATEANLKSELKDTKILHIGTHGFFIPSQSDEEGDRLLNFDVQAQSTLSESDPMLRSGLIFAGVTDYFRSEKRNTTQEDGILTAYEAMNLKLDNTELVVLSACETGLGKVQAGEGVYGLQRAFHIAGAKSLIMSLWCIDDEVTQELMQSFYTEWMKTKDKSLAFRKAQENIRQKYKKPYFWGAFVLI